MENFPVPSLLLLRKLKRGNVDVLNACKYLRENGKISDDLVIIVDKMYLRKSVQYCKGHLIGCDEEGELFKGIVVFMIEGLQKSVPIVVKGYPITPISGEWLAQEMTSCTSISVLVSIGFKVRCIVTDNHVANVSACLSKHKRQTSKLCKSRRKTVCAFALINNI